MSAKGRPKREYRSAKARQVRPVSDRGAFMSASGAANANALLEL